MPFYWLFLYLLTIAFLTLLAYFTTQRPGLALSRILAINIVLPEFHQELFIFLSFIVRLLVFK